MEMKASLYTPLSVPSPFTSKISFNTSMTILAIVPGKQKMCLQENFVDCADCGGLTHLIF